MEHLQGILREHSYSALPPPSAARLLLHKLANACILILENQASICHSGSCSPQVLVTLSTTSRRGLQLADETDRSLDRLFVIKCARSRQVSSLADLLAQKGQHLQRRRAARASCLEFLGGELLTQVRHLRRLGGATDCIAKVLRTKQCAAALSCLLARNHFGRRLGMPDSTDHPLASHSKPVLHKLVACRFFISTLPAEARVPAGQRDRLELVCRTEVEPASLADGVSSLLGL